MPDLPYSGQVRVSPSALPDVRAPLDAFGGGEASRQVDMSGVTDVVQKVYQEEKNKADQVALVAAGSQLSAAETDTLYNPQTGALNTRGSQAFGMPDQVSKSWSDTVSQIRGTLSNDQQLAAFDRMAASHTQNIHEQVTRHVAAQRQAFALDSTQSLVANEQNAALSAALTDPSRADIAVNTQTAAIAQLGRQNGWSPEMIQQHTAAAVSKTRYDVLQAMVDSSEEIPGMDLKASQYVQDHKSELVGNDLIAAERLAKGVTVLGESRRQSQVILSTAANEADALKMVDDIPDARVADATDQRLRKHFADQSNELRSQHLQAYQNAGDILAQTKDTNKIPRSTWLALSDPERKELEEHERFMNSPPKDPGDPEKFMTLMNEAYFSPDTFAQKQIVSEPGLNESQRTNLMGLQRTVGDRAQMQDETTIKQALSRSTADVQFFQRKADEFGPRGEKPDAQLYQHYQYQVESAQDDVRHANWQLSERKKNVVPSAPVARGAAALQDPSAIATPPGNQTGNIDLRTPPVGRANPLGLTAIQKTQPTPQMIQDVIKLGPGYATYLRSMGVDVKTP